MGLIRDDDALENAIAEIRQRLRTALPPGKAGREEWLQTLYEERSQRFLADNQMIWTTGAIMVPIAFAAFAVPTEAQLTSGWSILLLAAASSLLLLAWVLIHENLRAFQDKAMATLIAIERECLGFEDLPNPKLVDFKPPFKWITGKRAIQRLIWWLLVALIVGWCLTILGRCSTLDW